MSEQGHGIEEGIAMADMPVGFTLMYSKVSAVNRIIYFEKIADKWYSSFSVDCGTWTIPI